MNKSLLGSLLVAAASVSMGDVVLPATSTIAAIQSAIDNAQPGDVITLADGKYAFDRTLYVTNGVTLTGSGRDACILAGSGSTPLETGLVLDHADACVRNLTVSGVTAGTAFNYTGVGVQIKAGLLTQARVTGCKSLAANHTANRTAGVTLEGANAVMTHCLVDHNEGTAGSNLGGVRIHLGGGTMANCLVWANAGENAGGVSLKPNPWAPVKIANCTIVGNTAAVRGGGLADEPDAQYIWSNINGEFCGPVVVNTIIADNTAPSGSDIYFGFNDEAGRIATFFNCLCPTVSYGANARTGDPMFMSPGTGDFHLQSGSPARNAGDTAKAASVLGYNLAGTDDFYGLDRILESAVDIGCAEFDPTVVACSVVKSKDPVFTGESVTLTASVSGFDGADDLVYQWEIWRDGDATSLRRNGTEVELEPTLQGLYWVDLRVSSALLQTNAAATVTFDVVQSTIYVTAAANPDCAYPYSTPGTAATNLNEALEAAFEGVLVSLDEGTHTVFTNVSIPKGVTVRGAGRDKTTIYAAEKFYPVVRINDADAILKDVTVAHGRMSESWKSEPVGVLIGDDGGTMADCRVTDCSNNGNWRVHGAVKITGSGALVTRCLIDGNTMTDGNPIGQNTSGGIHATAGRIENCVITNNAGMAYNGANASGLYLAGAVVVLNCTVLDNRMGSGSDGGGVQAADASAVVRNCIIDGNLSGNGVETNYWGNGASFSYCLSSDAAPAGSEGCIVGRPVFDKRKPLYLAYSKEGPSPGRSQGSVAGYADRLLTATDFFGQPRVKFVSRRGVADIDIGATESTYSPPMTLLIFR
ncbi:MAG: hypothetical protein II839_11445 [Kiritimatiellae bacterium]|nr:hypothetical protein [Kiritimatiellia bacterium]